MKSNQTKEENELDLQINKYSNICNNIKKDIKKLNKKQENIKKTLEANHERDLLIQTDLKQSFESLEEVKEKVSTINYQIHTAKDKAELDFLEVLNLQSSIKEQIHSVQENISAINNLGDGWETNTKEIIHQCTEAKYDCFKTFDRWSSIWPGLNLWLSNDLEMNSTISSLASQQGLIGEWVALRSIACEIKNIADMSIRNKESHLPSISQQHSFRAALTVLRNSAHQGIETTTNEINQLKQEVKQLEKQRRQIRSLLLELSYGLTEDCDIAAIKGKDAASSTQLEILEMETSDADGPDGMRKNTPYTVTLTNDIPLVQTPLNNNPHTPNNINPNKQGKNNNSNLKMTSIVSSRKRDLSVDNYYTGGVSILPSSGGQSFDSTNQKKKNKKKILLVDKWLKNLEIHLNNHLGKAIQQALEVNDPKILSPPSSAQLLPSEPSTPPQTFYNNENGGSEGNEGSPRRRYSNTKNIVPFGSNNDPKIIETQKWRSLTPDELCVALSTLECRSLWRKFQRSSAKYISNTFKSSEAEWFHQIEEKLKLQQQNQQLSPNGQIIRNGITISLPTEGSIRHTFPLSRGSERFNNDGNSYDGSNGIGDDGVNDDTKQIGIMKRYQTNESILLQGVKNFYEWQTFRRTTLHAAIATNSPSPASPQYLSFKATKIARGPIIITVQENDKLKNQSSNKEKFLNSHSSRPSASFTPKSNRRKVKVNSEAERFVRRTERKQRIQTLVKKFQDTAIQNADKRGAVIVKEKLHIPSFVPKFQNDNKLILKPSEMFENSISSSGLDSESSMIKEEEDDDNDDIIDELSTKSTTNSISQPNSITLPSITDPNNSNGNIIVSGTSHPEKYSMIERIISKDIEDQVITQLTLRMGGEPINVVVYWLAKEECLRINAFCFQGSEEYTFNINQSIIEQLFSGVPHLQSAQMQSPYLLHNLVERMKIEKMRRKDALAVMMKLNNISNDKVAAKLARNGGLDTASVESILSGTPLTLQNIGITNEEDRVRVITLRSITTNVLVMCCIAKVRNGHWEQLLKAIPKVEYRSHSIEEFLAKPAPKKVANRHSVY